MVKERKKMDVLAKMVEKADKQLAATDIVVKEQKAKLVLLEKALECLELEVASAKKCVEIAVETSIDMQNVVKWLGNQE